MENYNCNNNTCNCAINKKYHLSDICLHSYPCRHSITYINEKKETNTISSANIVRLFKKENLPLPQHFEKYIESMDILNNNIAEATDGKYPYVSGYANIINMDIQSAARIIKLQYETKSATMAEYENSRIKYVQKILAEQDIKNIVPIVEAFVAEREY